MYAFVVLLLLTVVVAGEKYTTKYDGLDIEKILSSDRLVKNYHDCLMERGKCTPDGLELKKDMPDALETECSKCSDKQKEMTKRIMKFMFENKKEMFNELMAKYDPKGKYKEMYKKQAQAEGIKL